MLWAPATIVVDCVLIGQWALEDKIRKFPKNFKIFFTSCQDCSVIDDWSSAKSSEWSQDLQEESNLIRMWVRNCLLSSYDSPVPIDWRKDVMEVSFFIPKSGHVLDWNNFGEIDRCPLWTIVVFSSITCRNGEENEEEFHGWAIEMRLKMIREFFDFYRRNLIKVNRLNEMNDRFSSYQRLKEGFSKFSKNVTALEESSGNKLGESGDICWQLWQIQMLEYRIEKDVWCLVQLDAVLDHSTSQVLGSKCCFYNF